MNFKNCTILFPEVLKNVVEVMMVTEMCLVIHEPFNFYASRWEPYKWYAYKAPLHLSTDPFPSGMGS